VYLFKHGFFGVELLALLLFTLTHLIQLPLQIIHTILQLIPNLLILPQQLLLLPNHTPHLLNPRIYLLLLPHILRLLSQDAGCFHEEIVLFGLVVDGCFEVVY